MATNNVINNNSSPFSSTAVTINPGTSADSYVQFSVNSSAIFRMGSDQSASAAFVLSQGGALGTNNTLSMTTSGQCRRALQPAFQAVISGTANNVTGNGTVYTLGGGGVPLTEIYDQGANFTISGTFTAPVTGRYYFVTNINFNQLAAGMTLGNIALVTSNRTYTINKGNIGPLRASSNEEDAMVFALADMDTSDTAVITAQVSNGTQVVDVDSVGTGGFLAC